MLFLWPFVMTLDMSFNYEPVTFGEITDGKEQERVGHMHDIVRLSLPHEKQLSDVFMRVEKKYKAFNHRIIDLDDVIPTILAGHRDIWLRSGNGISKGDIISSQTFPQDYDFINDSYTNIEYICGMSVPPIMIKRIVTRLIESGAFDYKLKQGTKENG